MVDRLAQAGQPLLDAASFAARAHRHQLRKDEQTPYVSHVFRVSLVVRQIFGLDDPQILTAAVLHDTIEDTTTDHDELASRFGSQIADWVAFLTKDKRLPEDKREAAYIEQLRRAPWQVKVCKLADVYDNLLDSSSLPAEKQARTFQNSQRYLNALSDGLPPEAQQPFKIVADLLAMLSRSR
jgi:guanosine-3',5'-bis(diphosphate) 3'-pyrophosphohydrolase